MILTNVMSMWKLEHNVVQSRVFMVQYDDLQIMSYFNVELYQLQFSVVPFKTKQQSKYAYWNG